MIKFYGKFYVTIKPTYENHIFCYNCLIMMGKTVLFVKVESVIVLIFINEYTTQEPKHD